MCIQHAPLVLASVFMNVPVLAHSFISLFLLECAVATYAGLNMFSCSSLYLREYPLMRSFPGAFLSSQISSASITDNHKQHHMQFGSVPLPQAPPVVLFLFFEVGSGEKRFLKCFSYSKDFLLMPLFWSDLCSQRMELCSAPCLDFDHNLTL